MHNPLPGESLRAFIFVAASTPGGKRKFKRKLYCQHLLYHAVIYLMNFPPFTWKWQ